MKATLRFVLPLVLVVGMTGWLATSSRAQDEPPASEKFPGVKKALTPDQYAATGLDKLSPEERAKLDEYLRGYFTGATEKVAKQAAAVAVDQAVKTHKVEPPQTIESSIVGTVSGWKPGSIFVLENGQHWKCTDTEKRYFGALTDPQVLIVKDFFGYKMAIAGGGFTRVTRLQ
jgi:hypothetical protein